MSETRSTCPYCGVGCGVIIESDGSQIINVRGDPDHPANFGRLCTKGQSLHLTAAPAVTKQNRLLKPQWRSVKGQSNPENITWDHAFDIASSRLSEIALQQGADAIGFYISGQLLTEDYYVFNKLAKGLLGTNNIDSNSRLCMSSAVAGYKITLGADAPPACYDDINHTQCLFIAGSNTAWAHPILFRRIEDARRTNPGMKIIVVDPRRTETADMADLHLAIQPGTDVLLFHGMLHIMLKKGWVNRNYIHKHTKGFEALEILAGQHNPDDVAQICGISTEALFKAVEWFATSSATLSLYCQGLNQSTQGTAKNASLINLHLACAQIGKPGAGPLSLTGQPNAMGGREVGGMANLMSGHRDMTNPQHRQEVAALWNVVDIPSKPGLTAVEMFEAAADGQIKALWIACTNPAQSMPAQSTIRRALERTEFVIVQEAFSTSITCEYADLLLPASTWGEKEGTVTNSERRISRVRAAVTVPGSVRHDWEIVVNIAQRIALKMGRPQDQRLFDYANPESIWNEHRESTRRRDLDITGLSYQILEEQPCQWPRPESAPISQARLYTDGHFATSDGRAHFSAIPWAPVDDECRSQYPFALTTGRLRDQWHGMTRTGTAGRLFHHSPDPCIELNVNDMNRLGLVNGTLVLVKSTRGSLILPAQSSEQVSPLQAFIAMHWGPDVLGGKDANGLPSLGVNTLTNPHFCPNSKQPELKHAAVSIKPLADPKSKIYSIVVMGWLDTDRVWEIKRQLQSKLGLFDSATLIPFSDQTSELSNQAPRTGLIFKCSLLSGVPQPELVNEILHLFNLDQPSTVLYNDQMRQELRALQLSTPDSSGNRTLMAFFIAGNVDSARWLEDTLIDSKKMNWSARQWLQASQSPPEGSLILSRQICSCFNVREDQIKSCLMQCTGNECERLTQLQDRLSCGTGCGSCVPELKRLIRSAPVYH